MPAFSLDIGFSKSFTDNALQRFSPANKSLLYAWTFLCVQPLLGGMTDRITV